MIHRRKAMSFTSTYEYAQVTNGATVCGIVWFNTEKNIEAFKDASAKNEMKWNKNKIK